MSLPDAVLEIAADMEADADAMQATGSPAIANSVRSYAKQLRRAVKAAEGSTPAPTVQQPVITPFMQHQLETEKARKEFRKNKIGGKDMVQIEEDHQTRAVLMADGPFEGETIEVPGGMPFNSYTRHPITGQRYQLQGDNQLHYMPEGEKQDPSRILLG